MNTQPKHPTTTNTPPPDMPRVVTLCGSTRFAKQFRSAERQLSHLGYAVFSCGSFHKADKRDPLIHDRLCELHFKKIAMSHSILVLNVGGYIGLHTSKEILFARDCGVTVRYLELPFEDPAPTPGPPHDHLDPTLEHSDPKPDP